MAEEKEIKVNEEFEEYEPTIVELDGESFEVIDGICYEGQNYVALVPLSEDDDAEDDEEMEFIILRADEQGDETILTTVDDEALYNEVGEAFVEHLNTLFAPDCDDDCDCDCDECRHS